MATPRNQEKMYYMTWACAEYNVEHRVFINSQVKIVWIFQMLLYLLISSLFAKKDSTHNELFMVIFWIAVAIFTLVHVLT